jgi:hypothetical protein
MLSIITGASFTFTWRGLKKFIPLKYVGYKTISPPKRAYWELNL